jgi:ribosome-associated toxin RatA of RatAB toxin-antitoxin module
MTQVHRSSLVPRPVVQVYDVVNDVAAYPRRFDWCNEATVLSRTDDEIVARLAVRFAGMGTTFTTRNLLVPNERIELELVEGPFKALRGAWSFRALGDRGCKVSLDLDFEMSGKLVGSALAAGFASFADHLVDDFVRAALAE